MFMNCLIGDTASEAEHHEGDRCQRDQSSEQSGEHPDPETCTERPEGLVEQRRLETLAIHRSEADHDQREGRADRHRAPQPGPDELHPPLVLHARHEPERHVEQHDDGDHRGDPLQHLDREWQRLEQHSQHDHRENRRNTRQADSDQDRSHERGRSRRLQIAEEDADQENDLEPFAEDDEEAHSEDQGGCSGPGGSQLSLDRVESAPQLHQRITNVLDRGVVTDELPDFREATLGVDGQVVVDDPQRHFDQLEVVEVAASGGVERLFDLALFDQRQREIDADPNVLNLFDRIVAAGRCGGRRAGQRRQEGSPSHDAGERNHQSTNHPGYLVKYWLNRSDKAAALAVAASVSPALI